jgi:peptide/nickel transport system substrate-binding protein
MENNQHKAGKKPPEAKRMEKEEVEQKKFITRMGKRQKTTLGVIIIIAIASIVGGIAIYANIPKGGDLIVAVRFDPWAIDPIEAWDLYSTNIVDQVTESLFTIDITDPNNKIIPNLATSWQWSDDNLELTCTLRQGVEFHDGTIFNAQAVKRNFDRAYRLIDEINTRDLWLLSDGRWIIKETQVVDDYTVKFVLNEPYAPLEALLSCWVTSILSPTSLPQDGVINLLDGELIGTGPFIYDGREIGIDVSFIPNPDYWGGKPAIDNLVFSIIPDVDTAVTNFVAGNLSLITECSRNLALWGLLEFGEKIQNLDLPVISAPPSTDTHIIYLRMNNKRIPVEMRKAMAYTFDYDYWLDEYREGWMNRMRSPIPKGILYSNTEDFNFPVLDLEIARRSLQDANWPGTKGLPLDDDEPWEALVYNNTPIATFNYTSAFYREKEIFSITLPENFKKIGVKIEVVNLSVYEYFARTQEIDGYHRNMLEIDMGAWAPDFNDPSNYVNLLMSKDSLFNAAQIDDAQLQTWMDQAIRETNPITREQLYYNIQERFIEEIYPWIMVEVHKSMAWHAPNLRGFVPSTLKLVLKNCYFV